MKKLLIFLLLAAMVFSFASCKENNEESQQTAKTYTFTSGTTKIAIDADAAPILASLGEWRDYAESTSCAFEGLDKVYIYAGFELQTYPMGEKDYVYMIILQDDTVATEKGIRIGANMEAVIEAYGTPNLQMENLLMYNGNGMYLQFILRDDVVTSIQYSKAQ